MTDEPLVPGRDYYEEDGLVVFTEAYLLRRGTCCKSGCRHCPYGFEPDTWGRLWGGGEDQDDA